MYRCKMLSITKLLTTSRQGKTSWALDLWHDLSGFFHKKIMFIPLIFFGIILICLILFFVLAGKKKAEGTDLGEHGTENGA